MAESEKIKDSAIYKVFEELIHHRIPVQLKLLNSDYKQLTRITALADYNNEPHFIIATPDGFEQIATKNIPWRIRIKFTGRDHIKYSFASVGRKIDGNRTFVKIPPEVQRNQRRKLFRIDAPAGTKLCWTVDGIRRELEVMNLSIGGSLAALVRSNTDLEGSPPFADKYFFNDAQLVFPAEIMIQFIEIGSIQIKRMKLNAKTNRYEVALEFNEIDKSEERQLTELIYQLQRQHLRKRLPLDI